MIPVTHDWALVSLSKEIVAYQYKMPKFLNLRGEGWTKLNSYRKKELLFTRNVLFGCANHYPQFSCNDCCAVKQFWLLKTTYAELNTDKLQ